MAGPTKPTNGGAERAGLVVTNAVKVAGLVVVLAEVFGRAEVRPSVMAVAAFMLAGAQGLETFVRGMFGK